MSGPPAPEVVLEFLACNCKKECKLPDCQCLANGLKCSPACTLQNCTNIAENDDDQLDSSSEDEDMIQDMDDDEDFMNI